MRSEVKGAGTQEFSNSGSLGSLLMRRGEVVAILKERGVNCSTSAIFGVIHRRGENDTEVV
jgi:hypothetical protein